MFSCAAISGAGRAPQGAQGGEPASRGIVLKGVSKTYANGFLAVKKTDLAIAPGEFFSLLGSSGSGKTTTLKMLSGLEFATEGTITLDGVDITRTPANKRDVHTVFQNYALFPHMSVAKNVAYGLEGRGMDKARIAAKVGEMLEFVEMSDHANDLPSELSGGMQQRVALARALVMEPKALLLDEPLGALDLKLRHHMQEVLKDIHRKVGITFVYVTHDQEEAFSMSDRIGVMTDGQLVQVSTPEELYRRPNSRFVADFVGASNMVPGAVEAVYDADKGLYRVRFTHLGATATVSGVPGLAMGSAVMGVVRPQDVTVAPAYFGSQHGRAGTLSLELDVADRMFLGGYTKLSLEGEEIALTAHVMRHGPAIERGSHVIALWNPTDVWVVAA